jgi:hypothetical protein
MGVGISSLLRIPNRQSDTLVAGRILLLRNCHIYNLRFQYYYHNYGDPIREYAGTFMYARR